LKLDAGGEKQPSFVGTLHAHWKLLAILAGLGLVIALISALLLWRAAESSPKEAKLEIPPTLQELAEQYPELGQLFSDPGLGSVYKDFLVAYQEGGIEAARELAAWRGLLNERDEIRITLVVDDPEIVPALEEELRAGGITVEGSYKERINVGVPLALIQQLAEQQGTDALFQQLSQMQHIIRLELPAPHRLDAVPAQGVRGEGLSITGADRWHAAGFTGQSLRIGVLDLGFDGYRDLLGTDLPETVVTASFIYGKEPDGSGIDHGAACAEIVHEMAPGAELFLAAYDSTLVSMGQAVDWLLSQDVDIISNSTTSVVGPMDGSDEAAALVDDVASRGILWVNSAGNAAGQHYRGQFLDTDGDGLHEFPDGTEAMGIYLYSSEFTVALNWDDWQRVTEDYDLFLYDEQGDLLASSEDVQSGLPGQAAAELLIGNDMPEGLYYVSIKGHTTTRPGIVDVYALDAEPEFPVAEHSLGSPADARGALAVGATEASDDSLATYSSQGPSNDGRLKPDLSAPAGVSNATYAPRVFDGTSASTPHVAGAAALVWSAFPDYSAAQVRDYLQAHALDLGPAGPDSGYGYGRLLLPAPPGDSAVLPVVPTALPTLPPQLTQVPEPTIVAFPPAPEEEPAAIGSSGTRALLLLGGLGLCGGAMVLVGGGLLLVVLLRSPRRSPRPGAREQRPAAAAPGGALPPAARDLSPALHPGGEWSHQLLPGGGLAPLRLKQGSNSLGRSTENDIVLDDLRVSRRHARFVCAGPRCVVEDLGSANGVLVNQKRVSRAELSPGDRLRLGDVDLLYHVAASAPARPWLEVGGRRYPLPPQGVSIGRSTDNDIHLSDGLASRHHARIDAQQGVYLISDLDSANGTFVNGQRIRRHELRDGDEIRIGDSHLRFRR
jgi:pSer/pThr/pTyr-binding forkhead associated (FHA) protein/subtilisin family serine protease